MVTVLRWGSSWASRGKATVGACETYRVSREVSEEYPERFVEAARFRGIWALL